MTSHINPSLSIVRIITVVVVASSRHVASRSAAAGSHHYRTSDTCLSLDPYCSSFSSSQNRCPVRAMNTSSRVGLPRDIDLISSGYASTNSRTNSCPRSRSMRSVSPNRFGSTPNLAVIRPASSSAFSYVYRSCKLICSYFI